MQTRLGDGHPMCALPGGLEAWWLGGRIYVVRQDEAIPFRQGDPAVQPRLATAEEAEQAMLETFAWCVPKIWQRDGHATPGQAVDAAMSGACARYAVSIGADAARLRRFAESRIH